MRILYIHATLVPPGVETQTDRFFLLSKTLEGDVLQPTWFKSPEEVEAVFGPGSYPAYVCGNFRYHWFLAYKYHGIQRRLAQYWFYVRKGVQLHREKAFDCVVAYSHMITGVLGVVVKLLTGAKLIIEVATSPDLVFITSRPKPTLGDRSKKLFSDVCLHLSLWFCDRAHLLYPEQVAKYPMLRRTRGSVFHEYVTMSTISRQNHGAERYVLLVGAPWYLKGADLLVEAFQRLAPDFPDVKLKILGYYPDRAQLDALIGGSDRIEILKARPNPEALLVISQCEILVQPSRCEGMGRVVVEAMGAGVPVIGSDVGGIPYVLRDGEGGFIVPGGDSRRLEARMRELLQDGDLRERLGSKGYEIAHTRLNEQVYIEQFTEMVAATIRGKP